MLGLIGCLLAGLAVGPVNGWMVRYAGVNPVITTIAMLSVLQGFALFCGRRRAAWSITGFTEFLQTQIGPLRHPAS